MGVPKEDFSFTDAQFAHLEEVGLVKFSVEQRLALTTLAQSWIYDLQMRRSARPKQFRRILDKLEGSLSQAREACRLNDKVGTIERHLLHWAMEAPVEGAMTFPVAVMALENQIDTVLVTVRDLLKHLPDDPGQQRPFNDERRIIDLASIFEEAGGKAVAYWDEAKTGGMAETSFRLFARQFYSLLPADDKRDLGGLDDALRDALATRRKQRRAVL
jgi:hypothetical protein